MKMVDFSSDAAVLMEKEMHFKAAKVYIDGKKTAKSSDGGLSHSICTSKEMQAL